MEAEGSTAEAYPDRDVAKSVASSPPEAAESTPVRRKQIINFRVPDGHASLRHFARRRAMRSRDS